VTCLLALIVLVGLEVAAAACCSCGCNISGCHYDSNPNDCIGYIQCTCIGGCGPSTSHCPMHCSKASNACGNSTVSRPCGCDGGSSCPHLLTCANHTFCALHYPNPYKPCGSLVECTCEAEKCIDGTAESCDRHCSSATSEGDTKPCGGALDCAVDGCGGGECTCGTYFCKAYDIPSNVQPYPCACWLCTDFLSCPCETAGDCKQTGCIAPSTECGAECDYDSCPCIDPGSCEYSSCGGGE